MSKNYKIILILTLYLQMYYGGLLYFSMDEIIIYIYLVLFVISDIFLIIYGHKEVISIKIISISIKIVFVSIGLVLYSCIVLFIYWLNYFPCENLYYCFYKLFIFSLHYPIYIFIFIKPFVNHLDRSIKEYKSSMKDLNEKNETKDTQS